MARKRHTARIAVMQTLFTRESREIDSEQSLIRNLEELSPADRDFAEATLAGVLEKESDITAIIQKNAPDWSLKDMDPIARCTLYVGAYELLYNDDVPPAVAMNEAIDIAKEYGTVESGKFVNGVLNAIAQG